MPKKKRPEPVAVKGMSFGDMIQDAQKKNEDAIRYVKETGLCCACKKNPVAEGRMRCQKCIDRAEELLGQLRGTPGFMEMRIPRGSHD